MPETKKYIVIQKHTLNYKVGEEVNLTDAESKKLVNKIKLAPVVNPVAEEKAKPAKKEKKKTKKATK